MKKIVLFILFAVGFLFYSCDKSDFEYEDEFKESHKAWLDFKEKSYNSYTYTTGGGSWVGVAWETTLTVFNGKIIQRAFKYTHIEEGLNPNGELEWIENENEINSHKNTAASEALTLDVIYYMAKKDWLKKRSHTKAFFETDNRGMMSLCGYIPDDCMDDCFSGIKIIQINALGNIN
jgi:hypothetical protein